MTGLGITTATDAAGPSPLSSGAGEGDGPRARWLLLYGLLCAMLLAFALDTIASDPWSMLGFREDTVGRALKGLKAENAPLLGQLPNGRFYALGKGDDPGLYLFLPPLMRLLGLTDVPSSLRGVAIAMWMITALVYPLIFARLFHSVASAALAPVALGVCIVFFQISDVYWISAWGIMTLLPPMFLLLRRWPRQGLVMLAGLVVLASFVNVVRSQTGLGVMIAACAIILLQRWPVRRTLPALVILVIAYVSVSWGVLQAATSYRDAKVDAPIGTRAAAGHPLWHPAYLGLGYLPNKYGIHYNDELALVAARREVPRIRYLSPEYDRTMRKLFLRVARKDPGFVVKTELRKLSVLGLIASPYLFVVALTVPAMLRSAPSQRLYRRWCTLLLPPFALGLIPPLLAVPERAYSLGAVGALALLGTLGCCWMMARAWSISEGLRQPRRLWNYAGARLRVERNRRTAEVSVGLAVLVVVVSLLGHSTLNAHDRWGTDLPPGTKIPPGPAPTYER